MTTTETALPAAIVGKFNIALTESKFQQIQDEADRLVYNEDNLPVIAEFLKKVRAGAAKVKEVHKKEKAEAWKICTDYDKAQKVFLNMWEQIESKPQAEYSRIAREIESRRMAEEREKQRKAQIKEGIETNALRFASDIANCSTLQELTNVERVINLEKTRKEKYQEFIDDASERFTELNALLATQKIQVKKLEQLREEERLAAANEDDEALIKLQEQKEEVQERIEEAKIIVQETAINQSLEESPVEVAETIFPTIKARRSVWEWEVTDIRETAKK
ncbi:MAG TPA: hypothetical protein VJ279_00785, partial [Hanamia sp.]|nr:hypothetical protein [Hanamia sp.]